MTWKDNQAQFKQRHMRKAAKEVKDHYTGKRKLRPSFFVFSWWDIVKHKYFR